MADEVQRLAQNAREATSQIATWSATSRSKQRIRWNAMNTAISQVVDGSRLAEQAGEQMQRTQATTTDLVTAVQQIASRSQEQAGISNEHWARRTDSSQHQPNQPTVAGTDRANHQSGGIRQNLLNSVRVPVAGLRARPMPAAKMAATGFAAACERSLALMLVSGKRCGVGSRGRRSARHSGGIARGKRWSRSKRDRRVIRRYAEQVERIGSAAGEAGFSGLRDTCLLFQENLTALNVRGQGLSDTERERLEEWPILVIGYLMSPDDSQASDALLDHLQNPVLRRCQQRKPMYCAIC